MNDQDFELLSQLLDGELEPQQAAALEARLATEPQLAQQWRALQRGNAALQTFFADPQTSEVPPAVRALLENAGTPSNVVPLQPRRAAASTGGSRRYFAIAASVAALGAVLLALPQRDADLGSSTVLANALQHEHSGNVITEGAVQIQPVLSFAHKDGRWCREYLMQTAETAVRGVACRDTEGAWQTVAQAASAATISGSSEYYQPAGSGDSDSIAGFIEANASDLALDRSAEQRLLSSGWQ